MGATLGVLALLAIVLYLSWRARRKAEIFRAGVLVEEMAAANLGHYEYNGPSGESDLVCNGHFPKDSAEIVCFNDETASWLKANADFRRGYWPDYRVLVVASTEDALGIVAKAISSGLRVSSSVINHHFQDASNL
jgi:hypothetical protein